MRIRRCFLTNCMACVREERVQGSGFRVQSHRRRVALSGLGGGAPARGAFGLLSGGWPARPGGRVGGVGGGRGEAGAAGAGDGGGNGRGGRGSGDGLKGGRAAGVVFDGRIQGNGGLGDVVRLLLLDRLGGGQIEQLADQIGLHERGRRG